MYALSWNEFAVLDRCLDINTKSRNKYSLYIFPFRCVSWAFACIRFCLCEFPCQSISVSGDFLVRRFLFLLISVSVDLRVRQFPRQSISASVDFRVRQFPRQSISASVDFGVRAKDYVLNLIYYLVPLQISSQKLNTFVEEYVCTCSCAPEQVNSRIFIWFLSS